MTSALGQVLAERDGHVAGARGQVEQEGVEVAPVDVGEHLDEGAVEHRAAPGDDLVAARLEHADRDHRDAARCGHRHDQVVDLRGPGVGDAEHGRDRVAVDVGVDDADLEALLGQRQREVDRDRRLADAALAARDGEHLGQRARLGEGDLALGTAVAEDLLEAGALLGGHHAEAEVDRCHARHGRDGRRHVAVDRVLERAAGHGQQHVDRDRPVLGHLDRVHHPQLRDRSLDLRVVDGRQRVHHLLLRGGAHDAQVYEPPRAAHCPGRGSWAGLACWSSAARPGRAPRCPRAARGAPSAGSRGWRPRRPTSAARRPRGRGTPCRRGRGRWPAGPARRSPCRAAPGGSARAGSAERRTTPAG